MLEGYEETRRKIRHAILGKAASGRNLDVSKKSRWPQRIVWLFVWLAAVVLWWLTRHTG